MGDAPRRPQLRPPDPGGSAALESNEVREFVGDVIRRSLVLALIAVVLDLAATWIPHATWLDALSIDRNGQPSGDGYGAEAVRFLAGYFGTVPPLLIGLASLAITTLNPFGNPAFLLLYRWYSPRRFERPLRLLHGRTNRFHRAFIFAFGLQLSLLALAAMREVGVSRNHLPALLWVGFLVLVMAVSVLSMLVWIISLRRASSLIRETLLIAEDTLQELKRAHLRPSQWSGVRSPYRTLFREQEDAKRCVYALTEFAIRSIETRQRFTAREAVAALVEVALWLRTNRAFISTDWDQLLAAASVTPDQYPDWFLELLAESHESIALAATELHYLSVARDCLDEVQHLCEVLVGSLDLRSSRAALERALHVFENVADECVQFRDPNVLEEVTRHFSATLAQLFSITPTPAWLSRLSRELVFGAALSAINSGDVAALRSLMEAARRACQDVGDGRAVLLQSQIDLGASALAARSYGPASDLIDRFASEALEFPADWRLVVSARMSGETRAVANLPEFVKDHYITLFVLLAAGRARQLFHSEIPGLLGLAGSFSTRLDNRERRAKFVARRIGRVTSFPDEEVNDWLAAVNEVCTSSVALSTTSR